MREKHTKHIREKDINYYKNKGLYIHIEESHPMMLLAKQAALDHSLTPTFPIGIVIVKNGEVITTSANGNGYHEENINTPNHRGGCKRRYLSKELEKTGNPKIKSGEHFNLCPGCDTDYHAEARAITDTEDKAQLNGSELYMYGHWWCCKDCWDKMDAAGIKKVYLNNEFRDCDKIKGWQDEFKQLKIAKNIALKLCT